MDKIIKLVLGLVLILSITGIAIVSVLRDRIVNSAYNNISVTARGVANYTPDTALISAGITYDGEKKTDEAQAEVSEKLTKVIQILKDMKDVELEVYTTALNVNSYKDMSYMSGEHTNVNQQFSVKVNKVDAGKEVVQKIINTMTKEGVNQITSIAYSISDLNTVRQEAWTKAYAQLQDNIKNLKENTGMRLKDLTNWSENIISTGDISQPYYGGMTTNPQEYILEIYANYRLE